MNKRYFGYYVNSESGKTMTKIHLLVSGFVTEDSLNPSTYYGLSKYQYAKIDQTLSMFCSISNFKFSSSSIYLDYDEKNLKHKMILEEFINKKIPNSLIHNYRLQYFEEWKNASKQVPKNTDLILLMTNLDHAYVAETISAFEIFCLELTKKEEKVIGSITHWPENIVSKKFSMIKTGSKNTNLFLRKTNKCSGTCLINLKAFDSWWEKDFTNSQRIVRPDNPFGPSVFSKDMNEYLPAIEMFRHLDGYGHVGINSPYASPLRPCCTYIPEKSIEHSNWTRNFTQKNSELCRYPGYDEEYLKLNRSNYINLMKLSSAFLNNTKRNKEILSVFKVPKIEVVRIIFVANLNIGTFTKKISYWKSNFNYLAVVIFAKVRRIYLHVQR